MNVILLHSKHRHDSAPKYINVILIIKPTRCINCSNLFWNETVYVSDSSSVHYQEFSHPDSARTLSTNLYDVNHCCVYNEKLLMMDRGTVRNV